MGTYCVNPCVGTDHVLNLFYSYVCVLEGREGEGGGGYEGATTFQGHFPISPSGTGTDDMEDYR